MRISAKTAATIAVVVVPPIIVVSMATGCFGITSGGGCADISESLRGAMYTSGATLIGLATFGSFIGVVITGKNKEAEYAGAMLMVGSSISVIVTQGIVMLHACCIDWNQTILCTAIIATIICSFLIVCGFAYIAEVLLKSGSKNRDEGQSGEQDGAGKTEAKTKQGKGQLPTQDPATT